jgi:hypothetical protein
VQLGMSALGQKRTHATQQKDRYSITSPQGRDFEPECFGSPEVDHEVVLVQLLDGMLDFVPLSILST